MPSIEALHGALQLLAGDWLGPEIARPQADVRCDARWAPRTCHGMEGLMSSNQKRALDVAVPPGQMSRIEQTKPSLAQQVGAGLARRTSSKASERGSSLEPADAAASRTSLSGCMPDNRVEGQLQPAARGWGR
ncbi:hypothetical protein [Pseudoxanthomonas sp. JBR18]|uniref:hypothetical protein n=1 Tax=Pseudoxanthomonas sp. JBR18 TaxID=2969308 RepID=UPI00230561D0|nr:hypothetical protein [Pseudoxanthomonas sp. JBR18]WCE05770.1 hypothetical protein PJ250_07440 [Pseudoxanthomonas sp. JBR18]